MKLNSSAIAGHDTAVLPPLRGVTWGLLGVLAFSLTVPLTRVAVGAGNLSPLFVGSARAVIAALVAGAALMIARSPRPRGRQWGSIAIVAIGAVVGFPLLTSFALTQTPAAHGAVVIALLPAATAVVSVVRTGARPSAAFWWAAAAGAVAAVAFAAVSAGGVGALQPADGLLFGAVLVCALAYAEGGVVSRDLGAWQTISWALVIAAPLMATLSVGAILAQPPKGTAVGWLSFAYLGVVSMFLGFVAWYRGLALGPIAQISQVQLVQPVLSIGWAALLLREEITILTLVGGLVVVACALLAVRTRGPAVRRRSRASSATGRRVPSP